jgi:hypothetical protein
VEVERGEFVAFYLQCLKHHTNAQFQAGVEKMQDAVSKVRLNRRGAGVPGAPRRR